MKLDGYLQSEIQRDVKSSYDLIALFNMLQTVDSKQRVVLKENVQKCLIAVLKETKGAQGGAAALQHFNILRYVTNSDNSSLLEDLRRSVGDLTLA